MARTPEVPYIGEAVLREDGGEERWPALYTALFVAAASAILWALIIATIRWLLS